MSRTKNLKNVSLADLDWIQGSWQELSGGDDVREEHWSRALAGTMVGMFRWSVGEDLRFYELIALEEQDEEILMLIRHFDRGFRAWEAADSPVVLGLIRLHDKEAHFQTRAGEIINLVYRLESDGRLHVVLSAEDDPERTFPEFYFSSSRL